MAKPFDDELDLDFLPPRAAALLRVGRRKSYLAQKLILLFFIMLMIWAYFSQLHEVTKGTGKIIASSHVQSISNLEGGIIKEILVKDDQVVSKGQVLVRLDPTITNAKYSQDIENFYRYLAASQRLRAQIANSNTLMLSPEILNNAPWLVSQEQQRFVSNQTKRTNDIQIAQKDMKIKQDELAETRSKLKDAQTQYKYISEQVNITSPLAKEKIYSRMDYIKLLREKVEQESQIKLLKVNIRRQTVAVNQARDRLKQVQIRYRNDDLQELREVEGRLAEARGAQITDLDRLTRTEIRSPINGTIRDIKVRTVGGVIQPGEVIMDIVPVNDTLIVEAQISPSDIGFLRPGLSATIKVTAYDFSSYGGLNAVVEQISPDTITDKREVSYFRVLLRTDSNVLVKNGVPYSIKPGMQVEVDILTGQKSVMNYFMKPLTRALENAMTER